jgi:soluble P-type ATPase
MSKTPKLVVIHGLKTAGKSLLAERLLDQGFERVKMAGPLKNMVRSLLRDAGVDEALIEDYVEGARKEEIIPELSKSRDISARSLMMTLGDEWRNLHGKDLWVNIARGKIRQHLAAGRDVVVDDLRYVFELEGFLEFNPVKLVISRFGKHFEPWGEERHPGERPIDVSYFDYHFQNDGFEVAPVHQELDDVLTAFNALHERFANMRELSTTVRRIAA